MKRWYYVFTRAFLAIVALVIGITGLSVGSWLVGAAACGLGVWLVTKAGRHYAAGAGRAARDEAASGDPDADNWEGSFWEVQEPRTVAARLRLKYVDGKGRRSTRDVSVRQYGAMDGVALIIAKCHLRNATRTFRTDRVQSCIDLDTGEVITDLRGWLDARWESSPDRAIETVLNEYWDLLKVLYYVAKADGRLMKAERQVLHRAVSELSGRNDLSTESIDAMLDGLQGGSVTAFKQAFGRLVNSRPETAAAALKWSEQIVATDRTVAASEKEAMDYMRRRLASAAAS